MAPEEEGSDVRENGLGNEQDDERDPDSDYSSLQNLI
jgi:hypothetical protein